MSGTSRICPERFVTDLPGSHTLVLDARLPDRSPIAPRALPSAGATGDIHWRPGPAELWTCPNGGRKLVGRNMCHAYGDYSVGQFLGSKGDRARQQFDGFERLIAACAYRSLPPRPESGLHGPVRGGEGHQRSGLDDRVRATSAAAAPKDSQVEDYGGGWYGHWMRITSPEELDDELLGWLRGPFHPGGTTLNRGVGLKPISDEVLLTLAEIAATLLGLLLVAAFFYLETGLRRVALGPQGKRFLRATTKLIVVLYSMVLALAVALVVMEGPWVTVVFAVLSAAVLSALIEWAFRARDLRRVIRVRGVHPILAWPMVLVPLALPWVADGWRLGTEALTWALLLGGVVAFVNTVGLLLVAFDLSSMDRATRDDDEERAI